METTQTHNVLIQKLSELHQKGRVPYVIPFLTSLAQRCNTLRLHTIVDVLDSERAAYMHRISLWKTSVFEIRLHWIVTPDWGEHTHDHPFDFVRAVLNGGYTERVVKVDPDDPQVVTLKTQEHKKGDISFVRAETQHLINEVHPDTFTLVVTGPKRRDWGFQVGGSWVYWEDYIQQMEQRQEEGKMLVEE